MNKWWYRRCLVVLLLMVSILETGFSIEKIVKEKENQQVSTNQITNDEVYVGGMPIGLYLKMDGILVLGTDSVANQDGQLCAPSENLIKEGDYIVALNGNEIEKKSQVIRILAHLENPDVVLTVRREEEEIPVQVHAVRGQDGKYKLGIWIRDSIQGLGTVTYIQRDGNFGALGHGIHDTDTNELIEIEEGRVYDAKIVDIEKGERGTPGGLEGLIVYNKRYLLGEIEKNTDVGIYGNFQQIDAVVENKMTASVARKDEVKIGKAYMLSAVTGDVGKYEVEIKKINRYTRNENKEIIIEVTDEKLLALTGGIVQGMSGSPVIQNGRLVGAVTHVLVNDPTRGYGIFIENMLKAAE